MCSQQHVEGAVVRNAPLQCSREQTIGGGSLMASIADRIPVAYRILMCVSVGRALAQRPTVGVQLMDFFFILFNSCSSTSCPLCAVITHSTDTNQMADNTTIGTLPFNVQWNTLSSSSSTFFHVYAIKKKTFISKQIECIN